MGCRVCDAWIAEERWIEISVKSAKQTREKGVVESENSCCQDQQQSRQFSAESYVAMDIVPFVYLPEYPFVICKACCFACIADEVTSHLRNHHISICPQERTRIATRVKDIPEIIHDQASLREFLRPPATIDVIPFIKPPKTDGLRCNECGFITRTPQGIQRYCRKEHGWEND